MLREIKKRLKQISAPLQEILNSELPEVIRSCQEENFRSFRQEVQGNEQSPTAGPSSLAPPRTRLEDLFMSPPADTDQVNNIFLAPQYFTSQNKARGEQSASSDSAYGSLHRPTRQPSASTEMEGDPQVKKHTNHQAQTPNVPLSASFTFAPDISGLTTDHLTSFASGSMLNPEPPHAMPNPLPYSYDTANPYMPTTTTATAPEPSFLEAKDFNFAFDPSHDFSSLQPDLIARPKPHALATVPQAMMTGGMDPLDYTASGTSYVVEDGDVDVVMNAASYPGDEWVPQIWDDVD